MAHPHQEPVREPCPHCGESASLSARICPHCKNGLLVQVELLRPLTDGRLLHQLGRSLYRAGLGSIPVPRLKASQPIVVRDVTREQAAKTLEALNELGLPGATKPTSKGFAIPWDRLSKAPAVLAAAGALVLALALAVLFLGGSNDEDEDVASTPALALESGTVSPDTGADEGDTPATPTPSPLTTQQIAALASPSTVSLTCGRQVGSGSFVEEDLVISNAHVLCPDDDRVTVHFSDGRQANGWVRERHRDLDLVTVRVLGAAAAPLPIGDASQLRPGDKIVVIGTPHGMDVTVHEGVVSHMGRPMFGAAYIQIDANINPGNSGGPVLNKRGELVGVVTMQVQDAAGLGFALPINYAYLGSSPLFHASIEPSKEWQLMVEEAEEEERDQLEQFASVLRRPGLVHIEVRSHVIQLVAMMQSARTPGLGRLDVAVEKDGAVVCRRRLEIIRWAHADNPFTESVPSASARQRWLERHGVGENLWYGLAQLPFRDCSDIDGRGHFEIVLTNGATGYDRKVLEVN